jgi:hypothetical protein
MMADEPIVFSEERRRRHPFRPRVVSEQEAALVDEYARAYVLAERATVKRFETAMLQINVDLAIRNKIQAAYDALKNPERATAHGELIPTRRSAT